jgi:hypothetical protein
MATIIIGNSCDSNLRSTRERVWYELLPQSPCPGVNYSLFIMLLKEMMSMESKGKPGAAPTVSPLLSSRSSDPYGEFCVSLPSPHKIAEGGGGIYIVCFWSRRSHGVQDCIKKTLEVRDGAHHAVSMWDRVAPPLLVLVASPVDFFFSRSSISQKNDMTKSLSLFDVWKVPKSQKHAKTRKFILRC